MTTTNTTINLGRGADGFTYSITVELREKDACAPYRTTRWEACETYLELAITGEGYGPGRRGRRQECAGQIHEDVKLAFPDDTDVQRLVALWERWHLNGMKAGTHEQNECLKANPPTDRLDWYSNACRILREHGLYSVKVPPDEEWSPEGTYHFGRYWLVEKLPEDVEAEILTLVAKLERKA
jgi:hypothetical protein